MSVIIRECEISDYRAIAAINKTALLYDMPEDIVLKKLESALLSGRDKLFAAVYDGSVIGYVHAEDYETLYCPSMKNVIALALLPEHHKRGIGRKLLESAEKWAAESGACGVRLCSGIQRRDAHDFYRHMGYSVEKEQLRFIKMF